MGTEELTQKANHALLRENAALKQAIKQRGADFAIQVVTGLGELVERAAAGDPMAQGVLAELNRHLAAVRLAENGIAVVRG